VKKKKGKNTAGGGERGGLVVAKRGGKREPWLSSPIIIIIQGNLKEKVRRKEGAIQGQKKGRGGEINIKVGGETPFLKKKIELLGIPNGGEKKGFYRRKRRNQQSSYKTSHKFSVQIILLPGRGRKKGKRGSALKSRSEGCRPQQA